MTDVRVPSHAELRALSDNALLARLRGLPRDSAAREAICETLVSRYAGLVRSCVRPYRQSPEPTEDLLRVGYVGLLKAISNFDPDYGDSLAAFAQPCISGEIKRHFRDRRWHLRVRRHDQELLLEMRAAMEALTQQLGHSPDDSELARYLGVTDDDVRHAREAQLAFTTDSLDAPLSHDDGAEPMRRSACYGAPCGLNAPTTPAFCLTSESGYTGS